jgi:hypothetical protein
MTQMDRAPAMRGTGSSPPGLFATVMTTPHFTAPRVMPRRAKTMQIPLGGILRLAVAVRYPQSMPVSWTNE